MVCELLEWGGKCIGFPSILMEYANLRKKAAPTRAQSGNGFWLGC